MHTTIDYSKSPAPQCDAVNDIKDYLGPKWDQVSEMMRSVTHCGHFAMYCSLAGISGYPVCAWYELYHGQGSWKGEQLDDIR